MIREATLADMPALMGLAFEFHKAAKYKRHATFEDSLTYWDSWLRLCIESEAARCPLFEKDGRPIAFANVLLYPAYWNPTIRVVQELAFWVAPEHRRSGVGSAFVDYMVRWGKDAGARAVVAGSTVYMDPKRMGAFLRKHGFRLEERLYSKVL